MSYVWMTCQQVSQVILSHNSLVQVSVRVCPRAYTHLLKVLDTTQPVRAGQEPLGAFGTRGRLGRQHEDQHIVPKFNRRAIAR